MNTSQHALIPLSPKVTLLGLQLASRRNLPHSLLDLLFPNPDMQFRAGAAASVETPVPVSMAQCRATWSLIVHCHRAVEEEIKTNMWWQEVPDKMNHCN